MKHSLVPILVGSLLLVSISTNTHAQGTAFTYQGRLENSGEPAEGSFDLRFAVYDAATGGNLRGVVTNAATAVQNGAFTTSLDFSFGVFNGGPRWLEIGVRTNRNATFTPLTPRQPVTPSPYAIYAANAFQAQTITGSLPASGLNGVYSNPVSFTSAANGFAGDGQGLKNVDAASLGGFAPAQFWQTGGNSGAGASTFLGTIDNQPLEFRVNSQIAWRAVPTADSPNLIGGYSGNIASNGIIGGVIGGGGGITAGIPLPNRVGADFASVFGGLGNVASGVASTAFGNQSRATGPNSVAFGSGALASEQYATAMGGATIAGGSGATAMGLRTSALGTGSLAAGESAIASGFYSVALGSRTAASELSSFASGEDTKASGIASTAMGNGSEARGENSFAAGFSTLASGFASTALGSQASATNNDSVAIGRFTLAGGSASTALGYRAKAIHSGTFVWADQQEADFSSTHANQMAIRAKGGLFLDGVLGIGNKNPFYPLEINAAQAVATLVSTNSDFGAVLILRNMRANATYQGAINFNDASDGTPGQIAHINENAMTFRVGNREGAMVIDSSGTLQTAGPVNPPSDRNVKQDFAAVDPRAVLEKVASLAIQSWAYTNDLTRRHIGPVAQDFHASFGFNGADDKHIATVDADGVALAAIQGLNQKLEEARAENSELRKRLERLETTLQNAVNR